MVRLLFLYWCSSYWMLNICICLHKPARAIIKANKPTKRETKTEKKLTQVVFALKNDYSFDYGAILCCCLLPATFFFTWFVSYFPSPSLFLYFRISFLRFDDCLLTSKLAFRSYVQLQPPKNQKYWPLSDAITMLFGFTDDWACVHCVHYFNGTLAA